MADSTENLPISRYLDVPTCHVRREDAERLEQATGYVVGGVISYPYDRGFFIVLPPDDEGYQGGGFSAEFWNLMRFARRHGCAMVRLDGDAPNTVPELPIFDW